MKTLNQWILLMTCLGALFCSCNGKPQKNLITQARILNISIPHDPPTMDPRKGGDELSSTLHFMLFEGLTRLMPDGSVTLAQAESIDVSSDKKYYTFHLKNTVWSDGSPVTAYDFEKSWKDILDPNFPSSNAHLLYPIKNADAAKKGLVPLADVGIKATDAKTLHVELIRPTPYFLELISFCVFFPINQAIDKKDHNWAFHGGSHFTSNGFYILKKWKHSGDITIVKNPKYWNPQGVSLEGLRFIIVDHEMTVLQMYERGDLDLIVHYLSPLPTDALPQLKKRGILHSTPMGGSTLCTFNTRKVPFNNKNIRKAFSIAMNRLSIVKDITQLDEIPAFGAIPPVLKKNKNRVFFKDSDASKARELFALGLEELGIEEKDLDLTYHYTTSELDHKIAQALQQQWESALGVRVKLANVERKILLDKLTKRNYSMAQTTWYAQYSDQMNLLERYISCDNAKNYAHWENPQFVSLLDQSFLASDPDERLAILEQAEEVFTDAIPITPIYHKNAITLLKPHVKNVKYTPIGNLCFEQILISPKKGPARKDKI